MSALQVTWACLQSASALHAKQLVHLDFRYANVLWDSEGPFVIYLEMAATPPLKVKTPVFLLSWSKVLLRLLDVLLLYQWFVGPGRV